MSDINSSLPIRTENPGDVIIKVADATSPEQQLKVNPDGSVNITDNGGSLTVDVQGPVDVTGSTVTVEATDLDIRTLSASQDSVSIANGSNSLQVNSDGSINVVVLSQLTTVQTVQHIATAIASTASASQEVTFSSGGKLLQVLSTASGKLKVEIQIETAAGSNVFTTVCTRFNSTANPDCDMTLKEGVTIPVGAKVRVVKTNRDNQAMDMYSTIVAI